MDDGGGGDKDTVGREEMACSQLTMQDLTSFQPEVVAALAMPLGDYTLYSPPPPAGGAILSLILNVLKGFNFSAESVAGPEGNVTLYHHLVETFKFAGGLRWRLWDPRSHPDVQEVKQGLERRGQEQAVRQFFLNVVQAVFQDGACVQAVSDPRKQGEAAGY
ncbi:Gamma-glutamyltransferase 5 [Myotis davidii]|uniref:Gamma-glutamyltransferase 5 n=1 Tax=Myotis davidii TaxID=225400 RepID=L5LLR4_MYODS|nr:Gamma-glutamyltransferase 5 [Myotis davidii]